MLAGAPLMQQETGLSIDVVRIVQALVLLFVAADVIVRTIFRINRRRPRCARGSATRHELGRDGMTASAVPTQRSARGASRASGGSRRSASCSACSASCSSPTSHRTSKPPTRRFTFEVPPEPRHAHVRSRAPIVSRSASSSCSPRSSSMLGPRYERWTRGASARLDDPPRAADRHPRRSRCPTRRTRTSSS